MTFQSEGEAVADQGFHQKRRDPHGDVHAGKRGEKQCPGKFPDLLIFDEKRLETLASQWLDAGMGFVISRSGVRVTPLAPSSRNNLDLLAWRLRESECCGSFLSPKLTLFPIDRLKVFRPTGGARTAVLMDLRPNQMIAPFLKAKRALFFSKILYKYYGAELVVSEKHRSGALFHFKEERAVKKGVLPDRRMDARSTYK